MDEDVVSSAIGDFGRWQLMISVLMGLMKLSVGWFQIGIIFLAPPQNFWCKTNSGSLNSLANQTSFDKCYMQSSDNETIPCSEFEYDRSIFTSTITSEWNLVCSRKYFIEFTQMSFMTGLLLGFSIFGAIGDKYGRKIPLIIAVILQSAACFVSSLSKWYSLFIVSRFVLAIASGGVAVISFVLSMEVVGGKWRTIIPILYHIPFGLGSSIMTGSAYVFRNWRHAQLSLAILSSVLVLCSWIIPESPRWLLVTNQHEKAMDMLKKISKFNKRQWTPPQISETFSLTSDNKKTADDHKKKSLGQLFTNKDLRFKTLILCIEWFGLGIIFYGFNQYMGTLSKNIFIMILIVSFSSIPGIFISLGASQMFGRKTIIIVSELWTATSLLLILAFPKGAYPHDWPRVLLSSSAMFGMSIFLPIGFLLTGEMFPTIVRNFAIGITSTASKIGSIIAPLILTLERVSDVLPLIIFGILTIILTAIILPLPETKGRNISDTVQSDFHLNEKNTKDFNFNRKKDEDVN